MEQFFSAKCVPISRFYCTRWNITVGDGVFFYYYLSTWKRWNKKRKTWLKLDTWLCCVIKDHEPNWVPLSACSSIHSDQRNSPLQLCLAIKCLWRVFEGSSSPLTHSDSYELVAIHKNSNEFGEILPIQRNSDKWTCFLIFLSCFAWQKLKIN